VKRSTGLGRKTPLVAKTGLTTRIELPRGGGLDRRSPPPRGDQPAATRSTPQQRARAVQRATWQQLREATLARDGHRCAWCGRYDLALEVHHRAGKGMGGSRTLDHLANLVALCGWGNHTGCHGLAHSDREAASAAGMTVPRSTDPHPIAVTYHDGRWLLDDSGSRSPVAAPGCGPFDGNHTGISSPGSCPAW
jgi:hypothetical protein